MNRHQGLPSGLYRDLPSPIVSFGVYDGVHLGHQAVLLEVVAWAKKAGGTAVAMTFDRHPQSVLRGSWVPTITSLDHRMVLMERLGVDLCIVLPFSPALAAIPAVTFLDRFLTDEMKASGLVLGFDQRFGHRAQGDFELAKAWGEKRGVEVRRGPEIDRAGTKVSSTAIRRAIAEGRLEDAAAMLGRRPSLYGTVVPGDGRGKELGFPTANIDPHHELLPPRGVYVTTTSLGDREWRAVVNIGVRPTFGGETGVVVEAHVLGFSGDLYGRNIELSFLRKLREEKKFTSVEELKEQIRKDVAEAAK